MTWETPAFRLGLLGLVLPCVVPGLAYAGIPGVQVEINFACREAFDSCTRDTAIDVDTAPGFAMLAPMEYVLDDTGDRISSHGQYSKMLVRKIFPLDAPEASDAKVYIFGQAGKAAFNDSPIVFHSVGYGGWSVAAVAPELLKKGANELLLFEGATVPVDLDRSPPEHTAASADQGRSWQPADGELLAHLCLCRHPPQGVMTSGVIDLANPQGEAVICPLLKVNHVSLSMRAGTPRRTEIVLEARSGETLQPDASWSGWTSASHVSPARYLQWRATLKTADHRQTPVLERVMIRADADRLTPGGDIGLTLKSFTNPHIVRSSWPYTWQPPSARLEELRRQWKLDEIIAPGKTEMEQLVLLRNWVRGQWPHNDNGPDNPWDAFKILSAPAGSHGMCVHFAVVFTQCALALGFNARQTVIAGHYVADAWSNEYGKWVLMDVEETRPEGWNRYGTALYVDQRTKRPMNALEIHRALVSGDVTHIVQMLCMADQPGQHKLYERTCGPEGYRVLQQFAYPLRNNFLDQLDPWEVSHGVDQYHSNDYLWWRDSASPLCPEYSLNTSREGDLYWTINQAAVTLTNTTQSGELSVTVDTVTPNLKGFLYRLNGGEWIFTPGVGDSTVCRQASFTWTLRPGTNTLEIKPQNAFGRDGITTAAVVVHK